MNGIDIKNDFDSIFLAEAGETFDHVRNDTKLGSLLGIREARFIQCSSDEDIQVGDMLVSAASGEYFHITKISYEIIDDIKTSIQAYFLR